MKTIDSKVINIDELTLEHFAKGDKFESDAARIGPLLGAKDLGVRVVVEEAERVSPGDEHRKPRLKQESDNRSQRLRPGSRRAKRRFRPVVRTHQRTHGAPSVQELDAPTDSWLDHVSSWSLQDECI